MTRRQSLWFGLIALGVGGAVAFPLLWVADGIATRLLLGENQSPPPEDIGPVYRPPLQAKTDGCEYGYVATAEREAQIIAGFRNLTVGQSREEVRDAMGAPDEAKPMYRKAHNMPFIGWSYTYKIKMRSGGPNMNDVCVEVFFSADGTLHWAVPNHIAGLEEIGGYNSRQDSTRMRRTVHPWWSASLHRAGLTCQPPDADHLDRPRLDT